MKSESFKTKDFWVWVFSFCWVFSDCWFYRPKRVRFPKGKKVKPAAEEAVVVVDRGPAENDDPTDLMNPRAAAKERAKRRTQFTAELFTEESRGILNDVAAAEVDYKVGIFNLCR